MTEVVTLGGQQHNMLDEEFPSDFGDHAICEPIAQLQNAARSFGLPMSFQPQGPVGRHSFGRLRIRVDRLVGCVRAYSGSELGRGVLAIFDWPRLVVYRFAIYSARSTHTIFDELCHVPCGKPLRSLLDWCELHQLDRELAATDTQWLPSKQVGACPPCPLGEDRGVVAAAVGKRPLHLDVVHNAIGALIEIIKLFVDLGVGVLWVSREHDALVGHGNSKKRVKAS